MKLRLSCAIFYGRLRLIRSGSKCCSLTISDMVRRDLFPWFGWRRTNERRGTRRPRMSVDGRTERYTVYYGSQSPRYMSMNTFKNNKKKKETDDIQFELSRFGGWFALLSTLCSFKLGLFTLRQKGRKNFVFWALRAMIILMIVCSADKWGHIFCVWDRKWHFVGSSFIPTAIIASSIRGQF